MKKLNNIKIKYSSPASIPKKYNINLDWIYTLKKDNRGYYIDDGNLEQVLPLELIQMMFTPIGDTWEELLKEKKTVYKTDEQTDERVD